MLIEIVTWLVICTLPFIIGYIFGAKFTNPFGGKPK